MAGKLKIMLTVKKRQRKPCYSSVSQVCQPKSSIPAEALQRLYKEAEHNVM
jgi:hypothetical protein